MRVLILVLSYNEGVFADFMKAQQNTWDSKKHPDIDVVYYYGGASLFIPCQESYSGEVKVNISDDYEMMHWKFKLALDMVDYSKYDFIFRTNSCSYIDKEKLLKACEKLPKTGCYAGYHNGSYISGAGIFFTPDMLDILKAELTPEPHGAEDVLIGQILSGKVEMIADNSRIDAGVYGVDMSLIKSDSYHFRFKTSNDLKDRPRDVMNMYHLHNALK